jgi:hypothetical protein
MTYMEEHAPAWVAEVLDLCAAAAEAGDAG